MTVQWLAEKVVNLNSAVGDVRRCYSSSPSASQRAGVITYLIAGSDTALARAVYAQT